MKKILSLLTALTLTASGASSVISCNTKTNTKDQDAVDAIKDKIHNKKINVLSTTPKDLKGDLAKKNIDTALVSANTKTNLSLDDLKNVTYKLDDGKKPLNDKTGVGVTATITKNKATAKVDLTITLNTKKEDNQNAADAIKNKIKVKVISIPAGTNQDTSNKDTKSAIKKALRKWNPTLTQPDVDNITFENKTLPWDLETPIKATITVGTGDAEGIAKVDLKITLPSTADQKAAKAIEDKIVNNNVTIESNIPILTSTPATINAIKAALYTNNATLTTDDLAKITFLVGDLKAGTPVNVTAIITVNTASLNKTLKVTLADTDQQKVNAIKEKIKNKEFVISENANKQISNNSEIIQASLQGVNRTQNLTQDDVNNITFANGTLQDGVAVNVTATIKVGAVTANLTLKVTLASTNQQIAQGEKNKISQTDISVSSTTNPDTGNNDTILAIETALMAKNPKLSPFKDLPKITLSQTTLKAGSSVPVTATIDAGGSTTTIILNVTLNETDQQKADAIKAKIINKDVVIPGTDTKKVSENTQYIKAALRGINIAQNLTDNDVSQITFAEATLKDGQDVAVNATITVGTATASVDLNIKLANTDLEVVKAIGNKISQLHINVPYGTDPDTTKDATLTEIKEELIRKNDTLKLLEDLPKMKFSKPTLKAGKPTQIMIIIKENKATFTITNFYVTLLAS